MAQKPLCIWENGDFLSKSWFVIQLREKMEDPSIYAKLKGTHRKTIYRLALMIGSKLGMIKLTILLLMPTTYAKNNSTNGTKLSLSKTKGTKTQLSYSSSFWTFPSLLSRKGAKTQLTSSQVAKVFNPTRETD